MCRTSHIFVKCIVFIFSTTNKVLWNSPLGWVLFILDGSCLTKLSVFFIFYHSNNQKLIVLFVEQQKRKKKLILVLVYFTNIVSLCLYYGLFKSNLCEINCKLFNIPFKGHEIFKLFTVIMYSITDRMLLWHLILGVYIK